MYVLMLIFLISAACMEGNIRIADNSTHGGSIWGRVEVCMDGRYGTICDDSWDSEDSSVVCNQIGLSPYGMNCKPEFKLPVTCKFFCCLS